MFNRNRWVIIALVMVFGLPFAVAWTLVFNPEWLPAARSNYGALIHPPVPTTLKGAWTILVPSSGACDEACQRAGTIVTVVRRALGADAREVKAAAGCDDGAEQACTAVRAAIGSESTLVVVDPEGNAMMRYGPEVTPRDLLHDVRRLIKSRG